MEDQQEQEQEAKLPIIKVVGDEDRKAKPFEHSIYFEWESELDGKKYAGNFTYKKLTLGGMSRVAVIKAQRQAGFLSEQIDDSTAYLNNCIAHCAVWFEGFQVPDWAKDWNKLNDVTIVVALFKEGASFEASFRKPVGQRSGAPAPDSGSKTPI